MFFPAREIPGSTLIQNIGFSRDVAVDVLGLEARTCSLFNSIKKNVRFCCNMHRNAKIHEAFEE